MKLSTFFIISLGLQICNDVTASPISNGQPNSEDIKIIPSTASTGPSTAKFVSSSYGFDGPMMSSINDTVFDWWYFDCISTDLKASIVIIFYTALQSGFPFLDSDIPVTHVAVTASWPNGTTAHYSLDATEAVVKTAQQGSSGNYSGTGASWAGAADLSSYLVNINSPNNGIVGQFTLKSIAPAHYPCGPVKAGVNMEVGPNIGWSNALPDADGVVDFTMNGSPLKFKGSAYHDKNWSDQPFQKNVASWFWGHARLGSYSIVWFDFLALNGTEYVSAYVSYNGKMLIGSCAANSIKVRPVGANSTYPPTITSGDPAGFKIDVDLNCVGLGMLEVNVTRVTTLAVGEPVYTRSSGSVVGRLGSGIEMGGGVALYEEFKLVDDSGISVVH